MPVEERFITFDLGEIYKAVHIKCTQEELDKPPEGELTSIEINEDDSEQQDIIYLNVKANDNDERLKYDRTFFALALVFYCQGTGIPLPSRGTKTLKILNDKIIMKIELAQAA